MQDSNGHAPMFDQGLITDIRDRIGALNVRRDELKEQLSELDAAVKRYEKAILALEPVEKKDWKGGPKYRSDKQRTAAMRNMRNSQAWPEIREAIISYAHDHDEFTQADFREGWDMTSGKSSIAFRILHEEENTLRIARIDGNKKYYRLTKEALQDAAR